MEVSSRIIDIGGLVGRILAEKANTKQDIVYIPFKEGHTIPFIVKEGLEGVEDYNIYFSPRKDEKKGIKVPSRFRLSDLELELLRESSKYNQNLIGGSPYRKNPIIIPSAMITNNKGSEEFSGVLHYVLPEHERTVVDDFTGEEEIVKTGNYGILVVAGYTGEYKSKGKKTVFFEPSKYLSLPTNASNVRVTPYGLIREDRKRFFYEWLEKSDKFLGVYDLEKRGKRIFKSPLYEDLLKEYKAYLKENRRVEQPRLF